MTIGEDRVRVKFNPSAYSAVDMVKQRSAELIDLCEQLKWNPDGSVTPNGEKVRCVALAQTHYETAAMWAVKAATADKAIPPGAPHVSIKGAGLDSH